MKSAWVTEFDPVSDTKRKAQMVKSLLFKREFSPCTHIKPCVVACPGEVETRGSLWLAGQLV